ncbi:ribosomal protein S18-alanine N-acetyltransferase [uncultured Nocardioides sp.]|uniref:ribosomal protein S18-alanine N-acetyltransferase n=1 Tax=uncultured Nocardioides sp. TaxID=198441 RepID=UPI002631B9CD|nr:ribosomal protein S18-alanine N-acetyltransferase [uncultured Nocardioides sp.]
MTGTGESGPAVLVRRATRADVDAVASSETTNLGDDAWSPALVRAGILGDLPTVRYLLAETDGEVVGHAVASLVADVAELQRIAVDEAHRRGGVASALIAAVEAEALAVDAERLLLEVREDNHGAQAFYAAHGFVEIARRRNYYADGAPAVVMERRLAPGPPQPAS